MTRFLYLSDTHLGATGLGFHQQKSYPDRLPEIVAALSEWIQKDGEVDFVLHGGDMVDAGTVASIQEASELFRLPVPVYLCLGNHDLTEPDSLSHWMKICPQFFGGSHPEYLIETDECVINVVPSHWSADDTPIPSFLPHQLNALDRQSAAAKGRTQILLTHGPIFGLPPEQTGMTKPFHEPEPAFTKCVVDWVKSQSGIVNVLGAHNHLNMRVVNAGISYLTSSALVEAPFEFKVFEVSSESLQMETISLGVNLSFRIEYNVEMSFVQGREFERTQKKTLP